MNLDYLLYGTPDDPRTERSGYPDDEDEAPDASAECEEVTFDDLDATWEPAFLEDLRDGGGVDSVR